MDEIKIYKYIKYFTLKLQFYQQIDFLFIIKYYYFDFFLYYYKILNFKLIAKNSIKFNNLFNIFYQ